MSTDIKNGNEQRKKQTVILTPDVILRYLISNDDKTDTLIMCKPAEIDLITDDQSIHQALCSLQPYDDFKLPKLKKFFEVVDVVSYRQQTRKEKPVVKEAKVEEIRKKVLQS